MQRYEHGGDVFAHEAVRLDFSVNLNPMGMPAEIKKAIVSHMEEYESYPDIYCRELCGAIAAREGVLPGDVLCGNGAADLIYRLFLARRPKTTLLLAPTFSEYERAAIFSGSRIVYHRLQEARQFALTEDILSEITPEIDLFFLCNPNNPTGQLTDISRIERIAARCSEMRTLLVVDECFLAFTAGTSCKALLGKYENILILDAFTKRFAMAGLRLGYALTKDHGLIAAMREAGPCWNVSAVAQAAGLAALGCAGYEKQARQLLATERPYLVEALNDMGLKTYAGSANYILFQCEKELIKPLLERGILLRSCANYEGLDERFYRVCVLQRRQNDELINALREVLNGC